MEIHFTQNGRESLRFRTRHTPQNVAQQQIGVRTSSSREKVQNVSLGAILLFNLFPDQKKMRRPKKVILGCEPKRIAPLYPPILDRFIGKRVEQMSTFVFGAQMESKLGAAG